VDLWTHSGSNDNVNDTYTYIGLYMTLSYFDITSLVLKLTAFVSSL
jgi:hypothetical protein